MEYKQLLREYHDNLGIDNAKSDDLRKARTDFINTLKVMYGKTKFPKKIYCEEFNTTRDVIEDFVDDTLITGLTSTVGMIGSGKISFAAIGTLVYQNSLNDLDTITFSVERIDPASPESIISISIDNQIGDNLYTDSQELGVDGDYTFSPGLTNQCNFIVTITIDPKADTSVDITNLIFTFAKKSMAMPTDLIVPLRVIFTSGSGRELASSEIRLSEYSAWIPFRFINPDGLISEITDPRERYVTEENFLYDRTVGYLFLAEPDGVTLWWKPAIKGKVTLTYSTLPTLAIEEGKFNNAMEAFSDCLVAGATWRGLRRQLLSKENKQSEMALSAVNLSIRDYKNEFNGRMADWVEFTKSRASITIVEPFDWLSDNEMLRL